MQGRIALCTAGLEICTGMVTLAPMNDDPTPQTRHRWPLFLAAAVLLGLVLAFLWVRSEVNRTRERLDPMNRPALAAPAAGVTNDAP